MYKLLGKSKEEPTILVALEQLNEKLEELEKKGKVLLKKVSEEVEKAKEFTRTKNKRGIDELFACFRKKLYEQQIEKYGGFQLRIHDQMITLEGAKATTETIAALKTTAAAMKGMHKAMRSRVQALKTASGRNIRKIDDVDKMMDEINEQNEIIIQIQDALATPIGSAANFDEDELEAELEELESAELEEELLQPATTASAAAIHAAAEKQPTRPIRAAEEDELAALQAEMAL
ncbi:Vacuolar protein sorting-associated protein 32 -like protein 2 [Capsicum annuum]|nr:Vacuolar protein sorting-associated protein 32 -like protein 2 [Capsicum annuum]KAF3635913.1 Vacuolar protein sorting-associated protein 32 -like protein 2 [Capsicum annuum]